ncbi:MAG: CPBP family intramembrane metalloprotease, partial [Actinobacteria bacterium]|nr:CPBP family intramembrane metalloprotease [Actinomycetota bacterium]
AYNSVINRWGPFHRGAYVPVNLAFAAVVTVVAATTLDLSPRELGLSADAGSAVLPVSAVALFAIGALVLARSRHGHRIADRRVADLHGARLAYHLWVRIPLGTAVAEEVIFRGVLFAAWAAQGHPDMSAAAYASVAFGLWHVSPAIIGVRMNDPGASTRRLAIAALGAVVLTTFVGLVLTWLRVETGGLLSPILLHAGINSSAALAAVIAHRRGRVDLRES